MQTQDAKLEPLRMVDTSSLPRQSALYFTLKGRERRPRHASGDRRALNYPPAAMVKGLENQTGDACLRAPAGIEEGKLTAAERFGPSVS